MGMAKTLLMILSFRPNVPLAAAFALSFVAAGCTPTSESPKPSAPAARAPELQTSLATTASPAPKAAPAPIDPAPATPGDDKGRYGPKIFGLPAGCGPAGEKFSCNPLTNAGCNADEDEACDDDDNDAFACFPDSDNVKEGGECNDKDGPGCAPGMTCDAASKSDTRGVCRKFCCSISDCSAHQKCVALDREFGNLGVCK
jgi:hypothetical protein